MPSAKSWCMPSRTATRRSKREVEVVHGNLDSHNVDEEEDSIHSGSEVVSFGAVGVGRGIGAIGVGRGIGAIDQGTVLEETGGEDTTTIS